MDTSVDLLPEEEISALNAKVSSPTETAGEPVAVSLGAHTAAPPFQALLVEWNSVLARSLSGIQISGNDSASSDVGEGADVGEPVSNTVPTSKRQRPVFVGSTTDGRNGAHVAKKAHLMLFNKSASKFMSHSSEELRSSASRLLGYVKRILYLHHSVN